MTHENFDSVESGDCFVLAALCHLYCIFILFLGVSLYLHPFFTPPLLYFVNHMETTILYTYKDYDSYIT